LRKQLVPFTLFHKVLGKSMDLQTVSAKWRPSWWLLMVLAALAPAAANAGIDHKLPLDESGIWSRDVQTSLEYGVWAVEIGGRSG
jgi:hypothetical protein